MGPFSIRSSIVRLGIFISTFVIATILVFQLVWLKKVYRFEQNDFDHSVIKAIKGLYEDLDMSAYYSAHLNEMIESPESHLYFAGIALPVNNDSLKSYLQTELEDFGIFTDCYLGVYSSSAKKYIYTSKLTSVMPEPTPTTIIDGPPRSFDHLTLYFPNRQRYILAEMNFWIISSAVLLVLLLLLGGSLYYFYRQKFLNETQKDLVHNFAHEFKTPVSVIGLAADVLQNPSIAEKPAKLASYAAIVKYQADYLQAQTEKLLQFAYTESRSLHLYKEQVNMHELVQEAVSNLAPLIQDKKAELSLALNAMNPIFNADRGYLLIVITNLLDNALKYSKNPMIVISTKNEDHRLILSVTDNGIGIEQKQMKKIFRKFFRVQDGETYTSKGFGLGLSFVKKIATAHGGKVKVQSAPGKGSTFTVELPTQ